MSRKRPDPCPNCGEPLDWHSVDVGVGIITSPAWCDNEDCGYSEDAPYTYDWNADGIGSPRVPKNLVPKQAEWMKAMSAVHPVVQLDDERTLADDLHDALNPPATTPNIGLARIGAQKPVERVLEVLRQQGLIHG